MFYGGFPTNSFISFSFGISHGWWNAIFLRCILQILMLRICEAPLFLITTFDLFQILVIGENREMSKEFVIYGTSTV